MPARAPRARTRHAPQVAIVGGGISGLTAALRLAERGYRVTVYEEKSAIGGNLGALASGGAHYDVYPHFFGNFYLNFWDIAEGDLGLTRRMGGDFEPRTTFRILDKGRFPVFIDLLNTSARGGPLAALFSGAATPAEMLLWSYSSVDGLSYSLADDDTLDKISVEAFIQTRPYATPSVAALHELLLMTIWSVHGFDTSAAAYHRFVQYTMPPPVPLFWMLTGNLETNLMAPLSRRIERYGGVIETNAHVSELLMEENRRQEPSPIKAFTVHTTQRDDKTGRYHSVAGTGRTVRVDHEAGDAVIVALPPAALTRLLAAREHGHSVVDRIPGLAEARRLAAEPIPVLNLYFKRKLPDIPKEPVVLRDSTSDLTFLDLSQLWHDDPNMKRRGQERTVLCVAASDYFAMPNASDRQDGYRMISELREYLGVFDQGTRWGDSSDIDWDKTRIDMNTGTMLFANIVGGKQWQPRTYYPGAVPNLFFGGDCVVNSIRMATVESAVTSGLQAALGVWNRHSIGKPIDIRLPPSLPPQAILAMKTMMMPWAYAAKLWCSTGAVRAARRDAAAAQAAMSEVMKDLSVTPLLMAGDMWQTMFRVMADSVSRAYGAATPR